LKPFLVFQASSSIVPPSPRRKSGTAKPRAARAAVEPLEQRQMFTALPAGFAETGISVGNFASPTSMALAPDGRAFIAEQAGQLKVIKNGQLLAEPFLTVSTTTENERGLVGVEVDPNFATNSYVYVTYIATAVGRPEPFMRLSRFTAAGDVAAAGSETVLYETGAMASSYHNGGAIHFGTDGKIYFSVGENGNPPAAPLITAHTGKIHRINPDGSIPTDNPFYNQAAGQLRSIYAVGFRNPFSFAIQPGTGRMLVNDVGTGTWEEINDVVPGGNYGYPTIEGPSNQSGLISPLYSYTHAEGCAIVGGTFYNPAGASSPFPADYVGDYFFADLCNREIRKYDFGTNTVVDFAQFIPGRPVDLDVGPDGSLFYLLRPNVPHHVGGLFKVSFTNTGAPSISVPPQNVSTAAGQPATFSVSANGTAPLSYQWQRNGADIPGETGATYTINAVAASDTGAKFRVRVSNGSGTVTSGEALLTVATAGALPVATITSPAAGTTFAGGDTITFGGTGTSQGAALDASRFTWRVDLHHADTAENEHTHPLVAPFSGATGGSFAVPTDHPEHNVWLRIHLAVTDSAGLQGSTFVDVQPLKSTLSLGTNVPGLRVNLNGTPVRGAPGAASVDVVSVVGVRHELEAPATQTVNGVTYEFVSWSDAGTAGHVVTTPGASAAYTATYRAVDDGSANPPANPDLTVAVAGPLPAAAIKGSVLKTKVRVTNAGRTPLAGGVNLGLFLSPDTYLDSEDVMVGTLPKNLKLKPGASKVIALPVTFPASIVDGRYHLLAFADSGKSVAEPDETNNVGASATPVTLAAPFRDLSVSIGQMAVMPAPTRRGTATLLVRNSGNVTAAGAVGLVLRASSDAAADDSDSLLLQSTKTIKIKAGGSKLIKLRFVPRTLASGTYYVTANVVTTGTIPETDQTNNGAVSGNTFIIG
jgi:glucose/arabinose dehydrogenase